MQLLGHRGQAAEDGPPENTLAAVSAALGGGADGVEVDVRLTADGVPVCLHDADLRRVAWSGRQVAASTYADLQAVRLPAGQRVPALADVVAAVRGRGLLVLDLKLHENAVRLAGAVLDVVWAGAMDQQLVLSSFAPEVLDALAVRAPQLPRALITGPGVPAVVGLSRARAAGCAGLHPYATTVLADHGVAERALEQDMVLRCWTVNRPVDARLLAIAGVPSMICDDPVGLRRALAAPSRNRVR